MSSEKVVPHMRMAAPFVTLVWGCMNVAACSVMKQPQPSCVDSSQRLIEIAWRDQRADCPSLNACEFHVDEGRKGRCYVQVFYPGGLIGNWVGLVISRDGHIVERDPGI